jgi:glutaconate CoA-transferase subunit A
MVIIRHIIKSGIKDLTIIKPTSGLEVDLLIGSGCVKKIVTSYVGGESIASIGPFFRMRAEKGEIEVWETDEYLFLAGLQAGSQMLPFFPTRVGMGTSFPDVNPDFKIFKDPIKGETLLAVPPIKPDVAIIHAACSDIFGNIQHAGTGFGDRSLANAADRVIVEVEKIVDSGVIKGDPLRTTIRGADMVVRAEYGAHPFASPGFYVQDKHHLQEYLDAANAYTKEGNSRPFEDYLRRYIYEPEGHADYLEKIGFKRILSLYEY